MSAMAKAAVDLAPEPARAASVRPVDAAAARDVADRARTAIPGLSALLEGVGVRFEGADHDVLDGVGFRVAAGEAVCLVGPSGGGKSTILNLLAGLAAPTRGRVLVDGQPVKGPSPDRAVVFQDAALFPWLTLEQNIAFPLELAGVAPAERRVRVDELLALVHLRRFRGAYPHELSGGMRQRGGLARALATSPRMVLFDEPFAALDAQMRELLQDEVERIMRAANATMVFVTHQIEEAVRLGDRVVLIGTRPGRVLGEVAIDLPRPRRASDAAVLGLAREIAREIRAEVEKVAREEADGAWSSSNDRDGGSAPRGLGDRV